MEADIMHKILYKLDSIEAGQQELRNDVAGLKDDVAGLKDDVAGLKDDVAGLKIGQQEMRYDIRALKIGQEKLETGQQQLQNDVSGLKAGQQRLEADVTGIKGDIAIIQKDTVRIPYVEQAVSEVNKEGQQVQETVKRYEVTLGALSARSLEHEAKLKDIV